MRLAAFDFLATQSETYGDCLPSSVLREGYPFDGRQVRLVGPQGIFKPAGLRLPLTITTAPAVPGRRRPYEDQIAEDGSLLYRYRGTDPDHPDNVGLRQAMLERVPLIYFHGLAKGRYFARWPAYITGDDPGRLTFSVAFDELWSLELTGVSATEQPRRAYATRMTLQRLHQAGFRQRILQAYRESCAVCRLHRPELLDAAHIVADRDELGEPITSNGMALCKLHHAAFDRNILGVRPDLVVQIRADILDEVDGPMLRHGLQDMHGRPLLTVPRQRQDRPDQELLECRYEDFLAAR